MGFELNGSSYHSLMFNIFFVKIFQFLHEPKKSRPYSLPYLYQYET